jgi:hypothetical protein
MHDIYFAWTTPEYAQRHRTADWYWAVAIIAISAAAASILLGNVLFAILIVLSIIILLSFSRQLPRTLSIEVNKHGVKVDKELYRYENIESFWVEDSLPTGTVLTIKSKRLFMPHVSFPVPDEINPDDLRDVLAVYTKEEPYTQPVSERIMEYLGF